MPLPYRVKRKLRALRAYDAALTAGIANAEAVAALTTTEVDGKADVADLVAKADLTYTDAQLLLKADLPYLDAQMLLKASIAYVTQQVATRQQKQTLFKCFGTSTANIWNVDADLTWADAVIDTTARELSLASTTQIACSSGGTYMFYPCVQALSTERSELQLKTFLNGTELTDEIISDYVARDTDQDIGGVTGLVALVLAAGDVVSFKAHSDADGACTIRTQGTRLVVHGPI